MNDLETALDHCRRKYGSTIYPPPYGYDTGGLSASNIDGSGSLSNSHDHHYLLETALAHRRRNKGSRHTDGAYLSGNVALRVATCHLNTSSRMHHFV